MTMRCAGLLFGAMLFVVNASASDVYRWTGPDGREHFGDRPPSDASAQEVHIPAFRATAESTSPAPRTGVTMLSTTWCGVCKRARQYFVQRGIPFTELDVEKSEAGRMEYKRLNGRSVPIILVGDQRMNGFSAQRLELLLQAAGY